MDDKYAKELVKEMKLIRKELEYMNGIEVMKDGRKVPRKVFNDMEKRSAYKSPLAERK